MGERGREREKEKKSQWSKPSEQKLRSAKLNENSNVVYLSFTSCLAIDQSSQE